MLELDLDLEADLGIDTVKQAEVFAMVRETFGIPRQDDLKLRDYPTLRHVIGFVEQSRGQASGSRAGDAGRGASPGGVGHATARQLPPRPSTATSAPTALP